MSLLFSGADLGRDALLRAAAGRMTPTRSAFSGRPDIVNDAVIAVLADARSHLVEAELLPDAPCDVVVGAGCIATDTESADDVLAVIKREPAAEHDNAAGDLADHRIFRRAVGRRRAGIDRRRIDRVARDETVERTAGLRRRPQVGGRDRRLAKTKAVGGERLFRRNGAAAGPLIVGLGAAERDRAHGA